MEIVSRGAFGGCELVGGLIRVGFDFDRRPEIRVIHNSFLFFLFNPLDKGGSSCLHSRQIVSQQKLVSRFDRIILGLKCRRERTLLQSLNNLFLLIFDYLINFVLKPDFIAFNKIWRRRDHIATIFTDVWLKCALNTYLALLQLVCFHASLLVLLAFLYEMLPDLLVHLSVLFLRRPPFSMRAVVIVPVGILVHGFLLLIIFGIVFWGGRSTGFANIKIRAVVPMPRKLVWFVFDGTQGIMLLIHLCNALSIRLEEDLPSSHIL